MSEPAVWHAVLALATFHRDSILRSNSEVRNYVLGNGVQDQFMLQHYVKAIDHLQSHFKTKSQTSYRITLVACILFASLDLLRGHIQQSQIHIKNGLNILVEMGLLSLGDDGFLHMRKGQAINDGILFEAYARLYFQFQLFQPSLSILSTPEGTLGNTMSAHLPIPSFSSPYEAWTVLEKQLKQAIHLSELVRCYYSKSEASGAEYASELRLDQQSNLIDLKTWLEQWEMFNRRNIDPSCDDQKVNWMIRCFHLMATIMMETCLSPDDDLIYDIHTDKFISLAIHLIKSRQVASDVPIQSFNPNKSVHIALSIVDLGIIQPLFFLATKCRVHRLRLQAIKLLESFVHREGIWDSQAAGIVARKVMELEERWFNTGEIPGDDFPLLEYPVNPTVLSLPLPPLNHRLQQVEVALLGDPTDTIVLRYRRRTTDKDSLLSVSTYGFRAGQWEDSEYATGAP